MVVLSLSRKNLKLFKGYFIHAMFLRRVEMCFPPVTLKSFPPNAGPLRDEIGNQTRHDFLPMELQYACRYWTYHLQEYNIRDIEDIQRVFKAPASYAPSSELCLQISWTQKE